MLTELHKKINSIVPITGIAVLEDGSLKIDYVYPPDELESEQVQNVLNNLDVEYARASKLEEIENDWQESIRNGWQTPEGWKLGIDIQDITLLNGAFTLAKEAVQLGITDAISIIDMDGNAHALTLPELTQLMLQYGNARAGLSSSYAARKIAAKNATTLEELGVI